MTEQGAGNVDGNEGKAIMGVVEAKQRGFSPGKVKNSRGYTREQGGKLGSDHHNPGEKQ